MLGPPLDLLGRELQPLAAGDVGVGWGAFTDLELLAQMAVVLVLAVALAAVIAYHPSARRRASTLEQIEQPKTFMTYAMVAALIAIIVEVQPSMALVVFGIGGLMRFRTQVGEAKDTGRVILVTVVGLCCGLQLYVVAVLATALGWLLVFALERTSVARARVQGLAIDQLDAAATAHAEALRKLGCVVLGTDTQVRKHDACVTLVYRAPASVGQAQLAEAFAQLPASVRGPVHWA
jgi:uncharacterized membrane protein YhiD involved in acid resistance